MLTIVTWSADREDEMRGIKALNFPNFKPESYVHPTNFSALAKTTVNDCITGQKEITIYTLSPLLFNWFRVWLKNLKYTDNCQVVEYTKFDVHYFKMDKDARFEDGGPTILDWVSEVLLNLL